MRQSAPRGRSHSQASRQNGDRYRSTGTLSLILALAFLGSSSVGVASLASVPVSSVPVSSVGVAEDSDVAELQRQSLRVAARAVAATVGLRVGQNLGSGVIVSEDGLVLTAGHVVEAPGRPVQITLSDGRVVRGRSLGVNRWIDSGMLKIDGEGPWPHLELGSVASLESGEWVMALGHPGGVEEGRPPVVRLGRVRSSDARVIRTDCTIVSGDSGGPLVDLNGRVVGIHTSLRRVLVANDHLPIDTFRRTWDRLVAAESWGGMPGGRAILGVTGTTLDGACRVESVIEGFAADLAGLKSGDVITAVEGEELTGGYAELEQRISERGVGDPVQLMVDRSAELLRFEVKLSRYESGDPVRIVRSPWRGTRQSKNDRRLLGSFRESVETIRESVVSVVCDGRRVALGTIVSSDGQIVTKASELTGTITCWIDGRHFDAVLVGVDEEFDLALLTVDVRDLTPVEFEELDLDVGQWVITPGTSELPLSVGIVSAPARAIPWRTGFLGIVMRNARGGVQIQEVQENTGASRAGLRVGDVLIELNGVELDSGQMVSRLLRSIRPDSEVDVRYRRGSELRRTVVRLGSRPEEREDPVELQNRQSGPISGVRSGFPLAIHHDSVLAPDECGGPIVDLAGRAIGVNLARAGRTSSFAIPGPRLQKVVASIRREARLR